MRGFPFSRWGASHICPLQSSLLYKSTFYLTRMQHGLRLSTWFSVQLRCITNLSFATHPSLASSTISLSALFISSWLRCNTFCVVFKLVQLRCITKLSFETLVHLASSISAHFIVASNDATQAFRNSESAWFSVQLRLMHHKSVRCSISSGF